MPKPDEPTKDEIIEALQRENADLREENTALTEDNARLSRLLALSEFQKDKLKDQCIELRIVATDLMSEKNA